MPRSTTAAMLAIGLSCLCMFSNTALAQVQSTLDTMRIVVAPVTIRGSEIDVDIHLRVVDTLGAFAYRLRYDTGVFEPVQDTFELAGDTVVGIIAFDLHPGYFEQFAGSVREPGVITFLAADLDLDPLMLCLPGTYPAVRMRWRVLQNATLGQSNVYFENDSLLPATWNAMTDQWGDDFWRPVMVDAMTTVTCVCDCLAEPGNCNGAIDAVDVLTTVNIAFRSGPPVADPQPSCPITRSDVNCDGVTSIVDIIKVIEVAFRGADPTVTFCNPCE